MNVWSPPPKQIVSTGTACVPRVQTWFSSFSRIAISSPHGWVSSLRSSVSSLIRMKCVWCGSSAALLSEFCSCFQYLTKRSADPLHARGLER